MKKIIKKDEFFYYAFVLGWAHYEQNSTLKGLMHLLVGI